MAIFERLSVCVQTAVEWGETILKEIKLYGRGGQGVVLASEILASAFVAEGGYATAFPSFGMERRGAPVSAFVRFDDALIREITQIYRPDCLILTDPFFRNVTEIYRGLKPNGVLIINTPKAIESYPNPNVKTAATVDATGIALEEIERPVPNTCMVGAFAAATRWVSLNALLSSLEGFWSGKALDGNRRCVQRGYEVAQITYF